MEFWKVLLLTYISAIVIEGVPYLNTILDGEDAHLTGHIDSEVDSAFKSAASNSQQSHVSLFQRWKNRKTSTTTPKTTTVLPSITLADLSLKLATLQDQLNTLMGDVAREDDKITKMAAQMQAMSNLVDEVHATVIAS